MPQVVAVQLDQVEGIEEYGAAGRQLWGFDRKARRDEPGREVRCNVA
jgi:hypothetical protein